MPEPNETDMEFEDLSVLGQDDDSTDEGTPQEGGVAHAGKVKAAFVKMRQENKSLKDELAQTQEKMQQLEAQFSGQSMVGSRMDETTSQGRQYRENVKVRAMESLRNERFATQEERNEAIWMTMNAIMASDAAGVAVQGFAARQSPQVAASVLSEFEVLDEEDRTKIKSLVEKLPENLRYDTEAIREKVHSYIGQNIEKFTTRQPPEKQQDQTPPGKPRGTTPASGKKTPDGKVRLEDQAGAAAASGLKGGSPGVRLTEQAGGKGKTSPPTLTDEDIVLMRAQRLNPGDAEEVKEFLESKKLAAEKRLRGD